MKTSPIVSIVIPVFDDESVIVGALESCLKQTLTAIEVIVVDDCSTDGTVAAVEQIAAHDPRVRLISHERNLTAYQARRTGILAARAPHLLFVDGDDELAPTAAEIAYTRAAESGADLVQFGVDVVRPDGQTGGGFEDRLQPKVGSYSGSAVLSQLFPPGQPAQGQLWRFLFRTQLLREAYALMPDDLTIPRVNDLPITFLAAALAQKYVAITDRLYRYHFGRGGSGQRVHDLGWAVFYAGAIDAIDTIAPAVEVIARRSADPKAVTSSYASARSSIIGYTTSYLAQHTSEDIRDEAFAHLFTRASARDIVLGAARFWPAALDRLALYTRELPARPGPTRSILLTTNALRPGGVTGVLLSQARFLREAGFDVSIAVREEGSDPSAVPGGVPFYDVSAEHLAESLAAWADICRERAVDVVIDHHWLYSNTWSAFALAARTEGAKTIGWAHNFAGRSVLLNLNRLEAQTRSTRALDQLIVLSPLDVAFWKLRGMPRVAYVPNPPSPLLLDSAGESAARPAPIGRRIELVWWGRLEQRTKRVGDLVLVAAELQRRGMDFRLRIVGPDWTDLSAESLCTRAARLGVADRVDVVGPLYGDELIRAIDSADVFVNTSIIEGYPLTIPEAQSRGLPVAMFDLPWLALLEGNEGVVTAPQGDVAALATLIAELTDDPDRYERLSRGSIAAADRATSYDFSSLYAQVVTNSLNPALSPEPTLDDSRRLIDLTISFAEEASRIKKAKSARESRRRTATPAPQSAPERLIAKLTPTARTVVDHAPWLEATARRAKEAILGR